MGALSIGGVVAAAVKGFAPLEKEILRISQITGEAFSEETFANLTNSVLDVADKVGLAAEPIGNAVAQGVARGFSQEASLELAGLAGNLAVAAGSEVAPAIQALTAAVSGYGEENLKAAEASEILFETLNLSNAQLPELARQLGNITPSAAGLGITFAEVGAAIGNMTSQGLTLAESTTQLRTLFQELSQSQSKGAKVFDAISGKSFPEFIRQGGSLQEALLLIRKASDQADIPVQDLFGNINSGNAVLANTGASAESYNRILQQTAETTGRVDQAVKTAEEGSFRRWQMALAGSQNALDRLGMAIRPLTKELEAQLLKAVTAVVGGINRLAIALGSVNWAPIIAGIQDFISRLAPFGDLISAAFNALFEIDWATIFSQAEIALVPVLATISAVAAVAGLLAQVITNVLVPAFNAVAPVVAGVVGGLSLLVGVSGGILVALGAAAVAVGVAGKALFLFRNVLSLVKVALKGVLLLWNASPWGRAIIIITAITTAVIYAWREFETFRNVVRSVWIAIVEAAGTAVKGLIALVAGWAKAYLNAFKLILDGLAHLPDWLGGGVAKDASGAVQRIINGIDSIKSSLNGLVDSAVNAARALALVVSVQDEGFGTQGITDEFNAQLAADLRGEARPGTGGIPKIPTPNLGALDKVLNPAGSEKAAKKASDAAKKRLAKLLPDLYEAARKLVKNIGDKSISSIESGFDSLIGKYQTAIETAVEAGNKTVAARLRTNLKLVQNFEKQLIKVAKRRDSAIAKLDDAKKALADLKNEAKSFSDGLKDAFISAGSVATASAGIGVTFRGIRNNLKDAVRTTQLFDQSIRQLQTLGLNETSLKQLAEAGPAALDQARALARSGASGIKEINKLQAELDALANKNAKNLTDEFFKAGISAAQGLVKGLQSQRDKIIKEMEKIAAAMVKSIKKGLKIQSPSKVFDDIGKEVPAGMTQGIRRGTPDVAEALKLMATGGTNFGPGAVQINGVSDPAAARRAGILAGQAVSDVLERNRAKAQLAGVGSI